VGGNRRRGPVGGRRTFAGRIGQPLPDQLFRVGVEAKADLTAALLYQRRQPISEWAQEISRP